MNLRKNIFVTAAAALAIGLGASAAQAEPKYGPGVSDTEIKLGGIHPFSGPVAAYGILGTAISAYFEKVNDEGGVNGRKLVYVDLDDGYSPPKTKEQARRLVEKDKVLAIVNPLGTPTNSAIHKYMNKNKVPHLFVSSGAAKWAQPEKFPWTMGFQPTYATEGRVFARYVLENNPNAKIGILYQNDDYGRDYVSGFKEVLGDKADTMIVSEQTYEATDPTVDSQIANLKAAGADVFFNVSTSKFAAMAIRKAHDIGWKPLHLLNSVSASVNAVMKPAGFDKSEGIITILYMKDPTDPAWADDAEYKEWLAFMEKYYPKGDRDNYLNALAYAIAQTTVQTLEQSGDDLTRENVMKQAANLRNFRAKMVLPGIFVNTSPTDYAPLEAVQLQRFENGHWVRFGEIISAESS
ncbi:MAG: ABC transporter substrate-binding protein [Sneathiella sp.]|uniref:ABC transporter substrate-binding protein n=1 Tax=Sneathiella sp. TaxID=1964365 RepID=UPI003002A608